MTALSELARILDDAARTATAVPQLTEERPSLTVEDAYASRRSLSQGVTIAASGAWA